MEKFIERHKVPKLTQEIKNPNRPIPEKEIESLIIKFPTKKSPRPEGGGNSF